MTEVHTPSSFSSRLARSLSMILSPPLIALVTISVFAFFSPIGTGVLLPWQSFLFGLIFVVIGPILPLSIMVALRKLTFDVKNRRDRPLLYFLAILVYVTGAVLNWFYQNHSMAVIALAYAAVTSAIALVSFFWKVSAHSAGVAGPITGLIWVYGIIVIPFMILTGVVAWARWRQGLHTIAQLASGTAIAMLVTVGVYWILWGHPWLF